MPKLFDYFGKNYFIWSDEGNPTEPIHIHISNGSTGYENSDKFWLSKYGYFVPANDNKVFKSRESRRLIKVITNDADLCKLKEAWMQRFQNIRYFDE